MIELSSSNESLCQFLTNCDPVDIHTFILFLKSRFSKKSLDITNRFDTVSKIPKTNSKARKELSQELVDLLGWYGSNAIAFLYRRTTKDRGSKAYLPILKDVVKIVNKKLPRKERKKIPLVAGTSDYEQIIVEIFLNMRFHKKSQEEIAQILKENGLTEKAAIEIAKKYGSVGLSGAALPALMKFLGKKTVMNIINEMIIVFVGKFIGKEAAKQMAKRLAYKLTQKTLTRFISIIGWLLLAGDALFFAVSPARRISIKVVPFISLLRTRELYSEGESDEN